MTFAWRDWGRHEKSHDSPCPGWDSKHTTHQHKSEAISLEEAWLVGFLGSWQLFRTSVSYQHCMETESLLYITQQTATEPKYKLHKMKRRQGCSNVLTQKKRIWKQIILVWVGQPQPIWSVNGISQTVTKCLSITCAYVPQKAHHIYSYSLCNLPRFHGWLLKSQSSGFLCHVQSYVCTDVSGERAFSILKVMERESFS